MCLHLREDVENTHTIFQPSGKKLNTWINSRMCQSFVTHITPVTSSIFLMYLYKAKHTTEIILAPENQFPHRPILYPLQDAGRS